MIKVTVWGEFRHEKKNEAVQKLYPDGMHEVIARGLREDGELQVRTATLDEPEHGLSDEVLESTDVMTWWGHAAHAEVQDEIVEKVKKRVLAGMGLLVLHSGHFSKIFRALMGTTCSLKWREANEKERLWNVMPSHPITQGIGDYLELESTEMYGELFDIPEPDELLFISWFEGGEVFRSGCTWRRGHGKVFYFRPGHETYPIYHNPKIIQILRQGIHWAHNPAKMEYPKAKNHQPLEPISKKEVEYGSVH